MINTIMPGDCLESMRTMPDESANCCVTSPPYYGLRDYGCFGQIGLERTPEAYVAKIVEVFREVRRVLKNDGTLWLNVGDSYAGGGGGNYNKTGVSDAGGQHVTNVRNKESWLQGAGLKAKDLIGIPWMVAKALRDPYYSGKIKRIEDRVWLAAMIDGEGCMFIHKRKAGQSNGQGYERKNDTFSPGLEVANTHEEIIKRCMDITGIGSICYQDKESKNGKHRNLRLFRWNVRSNESRSIVREVYPFLVGKKHEARILLGCPSSGADAEKSHLSLMNLHNGFPALIDFPEPESMYEQGYYLRQDLIWSKPNPMPESVTDRCTKAHEYIFLLSKSAKYYYNAESIKYKSITGDMRIPYAPGQVDSRGSGHSRGGGQLRKGYKHRGDGDAKLSGHSGNYDKEGNLIGEGLANKRSVWSVITAPFSEAHFATFPEALILDCIKAGCPEGGIVLDPFMGAGTTALVARKLNRNFAGCELNPDYIAIAEKRLTKELGLFI